MKLFEYQHIDDDGMLCVHNTRLTELASTYGTPCMVMSEETIRQTIREFKRSMSSTARFDGRVIYASKAFICKAMIELIQEEGIFQDSVSLGELHTVVSVHGTLEHVYYHGNNKEAHELLYALEHNIHTIVVDHVQELELLIELAQKHNYCPRILIRIDPGVKASTHKYISTAGNSSKFGISILSEDIIAMEKLLTSPHIQFAGIHYHIGSQIQNAEAFEAAFRTTLEFLEHRPYANQIEEIDMGGGFPVYYTKEDIVLPPAVFVEQIMQTAETYVNASSLTNLRILSIEPGRSIVGNAGFTLYRLNQIKHTPLGVSYAFIDGGMGDNMRPALYEAVYEVDTFPKRTKGSITGTFELAGKYCETGDIIGHDIQISNAEYGDFVVMQSTAAYTYMLSTNYNSHPKIPVLFVSEKGHRPVLRRQTFEELMMLDV